MPAFRALDVDGRAWTEKDLVGRAHVLYFYPADETPGCVAQACAIRDAWDDFRALGLTVLGVSRDTVEAHRAFAQRRRLPFTLLSDPDGRMHRDFGALLWGVLPRRVSYLVDGHARVAAVYESHLAPAAHAARMLEAARELQARDAPRQA